MIDKVKNLAEEICRKARYVQMNFDYIKKTANDIAKNKESLLWSIPAETSTEIPYVLGRQEAILYEFIANSINYCYWYGFADIRPSGASASMMYKLLDESLLDVDCKDLKYSFHDVIECFKNKLKLSNFPLLEERIKHLDEVKTLKASDVLAIVLFNIKDINELINAACLSFPGYASDLFKKRVQLLCMQIQRRIGIFDIDQIAKLTVPADYQLPKILHHLHCMEYDDNLEDVIRIGKLIPKGSIYEIEIRAATIVVCDRLARLADTYTICIDNYLWRKRKEIKDNFHLTITIDY